MESSALHEPLLPDFPDSHPDDSTCIEDPGQYASPPAFDPVDEFEPPDEGDPPNSVEREFDLGDGEEDPDLDDEETYLRVYYGL
jgi:hypothetical protein